jgi:hypothetical protein
MSKKWLIGAVVILPLLAALSAQPAPRTDEQGRAQVVFGVS